VLAEWLEKSVSKNSLTYFGKPSVSLGEGGSIPFMGLLGEEYPEAQFVITGVLGPKSNAHGPNEFLHIEMFKNITCCIAGILHDSTSKN
jgi:acetylornithine deacetylase/succinyl-diaminopimelate desuccinylase-like protein